MSYKVISIFGTSRAKPGEDVYELAFELGRELVGAGFAIANGGYGGTMEASARGAIRAGGHTIGVTCSIWRSRPNQHIREVIERENVVLVELLKQNG